MDILDAGNEVGEPEAQRLPPRTGFLKHYLINIMKISRNIQKG